MSSTSSTRMVSSIHSVRFGAVFRRVAGLKAAGLGRQRIDADIFYIVAVIHKLKKIGWMRSACMQRRFQQLKAMKTMLLVQALDDAR
ncbi:ABC-type antimicrobial peptide transport [Zymobacter palmae]|uniref:ABC-type antimicrobial peptide transport n=1 Tax=Zymobacter palmae TaxID=33074 RepID=A0A348HC84_9GAMM|nr:ABC-type antimicrobial peptide transport [Zymobacter palmae]